MRFLKQNRAWVFVLMGVVGLTYILGCNSSWTDGITRVRNLDERYERCGISVLPPQVPGVEYYERRKFDWIYATICCIAYTKVRRGQWSSFGWGMKLVHAEYVEEATKGLVAAVEAFLWNDPYTVLNHFNVEVEVEATVYVDQPAVRYRRLQYHDSGWHRGERREELGYIFRHPENEHWYVRVYYRDAWLERMEQAPDVELRAAGEEFLYNVRLIPLTEAERGPEARDTMTDRGQPRRWWDTPSGRRPANLPPGLSPPDHPTPPRPL